MKAVVVAAALVVIAANAASAGDPRRVDIAVTTNGFEPHDIAVKKGETIQFVFTRKTDQTCARNVILYLAGNKQIEKELPLGKAVTITATFDRAGELGFSCRMGHKAGVIFVK